jgi:hypothetical protein
LVSRRNSNTATSAATNVNKMEIPVAMVNVGHELNGLDIIFFGKKV